MSKPAIASEHLAKLRLRAASRLPGAAGAKGAAGGATDALAVLHELASSPATAADALALLHELQVHQIELQLQDEELRRSRAELESALLDLPRRPDGVAQPTGDRHQDVVADSVPALEHKECLNKAGAVLSAIEIARRASGQTNESDS